MRYLGIDWGRQNIGLALAESETQIAVAFQNETNDSGLVHRLVKLIQKEDIDAVVIGNPWYVHRLKVVHPGRRLGQELQRHTQVPLHYQNEMFTTKLAQYALIERGEKRVSKKDDAEAARIILQSWLDRTKYHTGPLGRA